MKVNQRFIIGITLCSLLFPQKGTTGPNLGPQPTVEPTTGASKPSFVAAPLPEVPSKTNLAPQIGIAPISVAVPSSDAAGYVKLSADQGISSGGSDIRYTVPDISACGSRLASKKVTIAARPTSRIGTQLVQMPVYPVDPPALFDDFDATNRLSDNEIAEFINELHIPEGNDIIISCADLHGHCGAYEQFVRFVELLKERYPQTCIIFLFPGDAFPRLLSLADYREYDADELPHRMSYPDAFCAFVDRLRLIGVEVVFAMGNHELQNVKQFVYASCALTKSGTHMISNLQPFFKPSLREAIKLQKRLNSNLLQNYDPHRYISDENRTEELKILSEINDYYAPRVDDIHQYNTTEAEVSQFANSSFGWKPYAIIGNTLFFPHITASACIGGGIGNHSSYILDKDFYNSLVGVKTDKNRSRDNELWWKYPDHPMLRETATNFCAAVSKLLAHSNGGPVNIMLASHATLAQTEQFWQTLFTHYKAKIEAAFGTQRHFEETSFHICGGHHHDLFDPSIEKNQNNPIFRAPFIVKFPLFDTEKFVNFTAEEMFGTHLHVITVPRQSPISLEPSAP